MFLMVKYNLWMCKSFRSPSTLKWHLMLMCKPWVGSWSVMKLSLLKFGPLCTPFNFRTYWYRLCKQCKYLLSFSMWIWYMISIPTSNLGVSIARYVVLIKILSKCSIMNILLNSKETTCKLPLAIWTLAIKQ